MAYKNIKAIYEDIINNIKNEGLYKEERIILSPQNSRIEVKYPDNNIRKDIINLCSNNYLGLSNNPELIKAAHETLESKGYGMSSVRFICGTQDIHKELEYKLSNFLGMEASILFSSCFDANAALFETILTAEDAVFSDRLVHASIIDGIRLCKAKKQIYEHLDSNDLEEKLKNTDARIKLIMTDGVFSMDGDMAKLDELCALAEKYDAILVSDESHSTGFIGSKGRGVHEYYNVMDKVDIITTTFGKALGGASGGAISGKKEIVDLLRQKARPYLFSNSLMPAIVSATIKALDILVANTELVDKLSALTIRWRSYLKEAGFSLKTGNTPIVPVMLYDAKLAQIFSKDLYQEGVYAVGFFYPVVAKDQARIRTQMSASLNDTDLDKAINAFVKVGKKHKVI